MKNNNDAARQENKKALPKFIAIMIAGLIGGMVLGLALASSHIENLGDALAAAGLFFTSKIAGWLLIALPITELAVCLPIYFGAKKRLAGWNGEDEAVSGNVESRLSVCIWISGMVIILDMFLLAALISGFVSNVGTERDMGPVMFFSGTAAFLVTLLVTVILQQILVDASKRLNPEKQGSVYDTKFQKKWMGSCDEAERAFIGQCALKAYQAMSRVCLGLWLVFALGGMFLDWGFLPALAVCIIWGAGQSVYSYWALKLARPGAGV